jgi:hypothetical protein
MLLGGFEPSVQAIKRQQTYAWDRTATGIGLIRIRNIKTTLCSVEQINTNLHQPISLDHTVLLTHTNSCHFPQVGLSEGMRCVCVSNLQVMWELLWSIAYFCANLKLKSTYYKNCGRKFKISGCAFYKQHNTLQRYAVDHFILFTQCTATNQTHNNEPTECTSIN